MGERATVCTALSRGPAPLPPPRRTPLNTQVGRTAAGRQSICPCRTHSVVGPQAFCLCPYLSLSLWTWGPIDRPLISPAISGAVPPISIPVLTSSNFDWARHYDNRNRSGTGDLGTIWTISRLLLKSPFNVLYGGSVEWSLNQPEWTQWESV